MNTNHVNGLAVVSIGTGEKLGSVTEILLDPNAERISAFAVDSGSGGILSAQGSKTRWIAADQVRAIGPDAMTVQDASVLSDTAADGETIALSMVMGEKVVTEGGTYVGQVASMDIDDSSMTVSGLEVSAGFFKSTRLVAKDDLITVGDELIIVNDSVCTDTTDANTVESRPGVVTESYGIRQEASDEQ